jgi:ABC-type nitrate/sulfonate/bicarbonate transport system ATPase subunit
VTHLIEEAVSLSDRIMVLSGRPGTVEKIIENDLPRPRNPKSNGFEKIANELVKMIRP